MKTIVTVTLPDIGEGVVEGEIVKWLKEEGESVGQDEPVVVVMTDKATVELPSPHIGILHKQYQQEGETAIKDKPVYDLEVEGEVENVPAETREEKKEVKRIEKPSTGATKTIPPVRRLAKELHVDIDQVEGTGPDGRVTEADVVRFHAKIPYGKNKAVSETLHLPDDIKEPMIGMRKMTAERVSESKTVVPHFSFFDQADVTRLIKLRERVNEQASKEGYSATYMPFFIRALSKALRNHPHCNASVDAASHSLLIHRHHHIGIATKMEMGLGVAVLKDVQEMTLQELIQSYCELMVKAKEGKLKRSDMTGSTITISNFGPLGGMWATPIINYPEAAILGVAKIRPQPVVKNRQVVVRSMLNLSWSFDHRIIDGDGAAAVSNEVIALLENPASLL